MADERAADRPARLSQVRRRIPRLPRPRIVLGSAGVILLYHRVAELAHDPQMLAVVPRRFASHLEIIRRRYAVLRIDEVRPDRGDGKLPRRWVAVTFDDGYADALLEARPLLERFDVPATVYVASGQIGRATEFWWDELERLVLVGARPAGLTLRLGDRLLTWALADGDAGPQDDRDSWHIERDDDPTLRHRAYRELYAILHELDATEREGLLDQLRTWAGVSSEGRATHRTLGESEVATLAASTVVDIGAHTVSHPHLARLGREAQRAEIVESRRRLEAIVGRRIRSFAYPHGSYDSLTLALVPEAGYETACSSDAGPVRRATDRYRLPRLGVRDWDGERFARELDHWFRYL